MPREFFDIEKITYGSRNGSAAPAHEEIRRELRSEKVQEIVSDKPGFLIRWGNLLFLIILALIILACWFIKYPDIIQTTAKLTSINAPKRVLTLTGGKLVKLIMIENQMVTKGQILGHIESTANHAEVLKLSSHIDSVEVLFTNHKTEQLQLYLKTDISGWASFNHPTRYFHKHFFLSAIICPMGFM